MSCHLCRFFNKSAKPEVEFRRPIPDGYFEQEGECQFNPVSVRKRYSDACGQFSPESPGEPGRYYRQMFEASDEFYAERANRLALEKKAKELRAQIKALKSRLRSG